MTEDEMMADLAAADAAGDTALAQHIAGRIKAMRAPPPAPPDIGESLARGAGQGATLGFGDELNAGIQALGIKALGQTGAQKSLGQLYRENRDAFRRENAAAQAAHPWAYGGGQLVGGAPLALATGGGGTARLIGTSAALGGAAGLGESTAEGVGGQALDTAKGAALGGALAAAPVVVGKAVPSLRDALDKLAVASGRRALRNVGGSISASAPVADDAVREALSSGAIRVGGTTEGAASRLEALRTSLGGRKRAVMNELAQRGITGPAADAMAQRFMQEGASAATGTMNPSVPRIYESAAEQVAGKAAPGGKLSIEQAEDLKGSLQDMARAAYRQLDPNEVAQAREGAASLMRQGVEDTIAQQAATTSPETQAIAAQFVPLKEKLANTIAAHEVAKVGAARGANRSHFSIADIAAGLGGYTHGGPIGGVGGALVSHLARTRGPSTTAQLAFQGARGLDYLMGPALTPMQARTQALIRALRTRALPLAAEEAGGSTSR